MQSIDNQKCISIFSRKLSIVFVFLDKQKNTPYRLKQYGVSISLFSSVLVHSHNICT